MRFDDLNWMDVVSYLEHEDRLMLVLGSCEQHGYLSLQTDQKIPLALADAASQTTGVLVAPALNFGISPYFQTYPGTISLRTGTFLDVVEDIVRSVYQSGFRRILVLNGHGGNVPARLRLVELSNELSGLQVSWYAWWESHSVTEVAMKHGLKSYHAGWIEAFPFVRVADLPAGEKIPPSIKGLLNAEETRAAYGDGVFGGPYQADDELMNAVFSTALEDILHLLAF
jgi:creatinine amidohydrolase